MRKTLIFCALILGAGAVNAQFSIRAGADFYAGKATMDNVSVKYDTKVGFTAGIGYRIGISNNFAFAPSVNFTQKGGKFSESGDNENLTLNYIEVPLSFLYNVGGGSGGFYIGAGPDVALGIGGKDKSTIDGQTEKTDVKFGSGDDADFKSLEFSANVIAGYRLSNGVFIVANYNPGISNIAPSNSGGGKWHNNGFAVRVGFLFGGAGKSKSTSSSNSK